MRRRLPLASLGEGLRKAAGLEVLAESDGELGFGWSPTPCRSAAWLLLKVVVVFSFNLVPAQGVAVGCKPGAQCVLRSGSSKPFVCITKVFGEVYRDGQSDEMGGQAITGTVIEANQFCGQLTQDGVGGSEITAQQAGG